MTAPPAPLADRVRVVTGVRSISESVAWMAREVGIFKRLGLEITFPRLERPSAAGIQSLLGELARRQPSADALRATDVADTSFLDELERTGFIRTLYGGDHP